MHVIRFTGGVGDAGWQVYQVKPEYRSGGARDTVEVQWEMYEVRHEHGESEWRIAVDRQGTIWSAQASAATLHE